MGNAAVNLVVHISDKVIAFHSFGCISWSRIIGSCDSSIVWETTKLFSTEAADFDILTAMVRFQFLYILISTCFVFNYSHSSRYKRYLIVVLIFISLMINDVEHLFMDDLCIFFGEMSIQVLCPYLNWLLLLLLSFRSSFYSPNGNPLSHIWFVNIFFHSISYLFTLLRVTLDTQKLLILMKSSLLVAWLLVSYHWNLCQI